MGHPPLSNFLADLAERASEAFRRGNVRSVEAAASYLDCGNILVEAKQDAGHGLWLPFLERAGIPARTAQRMMRLAASGIEADALAERGIRAALAAMGRPAKNDTVTHFTAPTETADPAARARTRRAERRRKNRCVDCGSASDGHAR